jgi:glycosyltransferase involved in cell wall biosynthesis
MNSEIKLLSVVVPCFNEAEGMPMLLDRLLAMRAQLQQLASVEFIFVDDHSTDETARLLDQLCDQHSFVKYIRLSKNSGSHVAIIAGMTHAKGDAAVFLAADLQDPPEMVVTMFEKWSEGYDVVWAVRRERLGISRFELLFSRMFYYLLNRMTNMKFPSKGADYALIDRRVINGLVDAAGSKPSLVALIVWLGFKQLEIPYTKEERKFGKSKWNLSKKLNAFADAFVGFSYFPMRFMSLLGFSAAFIGFLYAVFVIIMRFVIGDPIEGWASLMVVTLIIGGLQMLMLGVLGEYLWRNLEESRKRPLFLIEDKKGIES